MLFILYPGDAHYKQNEFNEALNYFTQALEMRRRLHSGDHDDIADTLNRIGKMKYSRQRYLTKQIKVIIVRQRIQSITNVWRIYQKGFLVII